MQLAGNGWPCSMSVAPGASYCGTQAKPHFENVDLSATDIVDTVVDRGRYRAFFLGDLTGGYPEIPSASYDVVVCEQVLDICTISMRRWRHCSGWSNRAAG
jgi:hypothetical protein